MCIVVADFKFSLSPDLNDVIPDKVVVDKLNESLKKYFELYGGVN